MAVNRDVPVNINPEVPKDQQLAFINQNFQTLSNSLNPFIVSDGTNNRIILGKLPDGTYGLVISKPGYDVSSLFS